MSVIDSKMLTIGEYEVTVTTYTQRQDIEGEWIELSREGISDDSINASIISTMSNILIPQDHESVWVHIVPIEAKGVSNEY